MDIIAELLKGVYSGPNLYLFGMLNVIALFAHRQASISTKYAFSAAGLIGGIMGALGAFIETQATVGINPAIIMNNTLVGFFVGCGSSLIIGYSVSFGADKLGMPISQEKIVAEEIRNPFSPTQPAGRDVRSDDEKPLPVMQNLG